MEIRELVKEEYGAALDLAWEVFQKFSERKTYFDLVSQNPLLLQSEEDNWEVPVGSS